jgi:hypothetical protein
VLLGGLFEGARENQSKENRYGAQHAHTAAEIFLTPKKPRPGRHPAPEFPTGMSIIHRVAAIASLRRVPGTAERYPAELGRATVGGHRHHPAPAPARGGRAEARPWGDVTPARVAGRGHSTTWPLLSCFAAIGDGMSQSPSRPSATA